MQFIFLIGNNAFNYNYLCYNKYIPLMREVLYMAEQNFRIGIGYDIHKLVEGRDLIIGGVKIPYKKGLAL